MISPHLSLSLSKYSFCFWRPLLTLALVAIALGHAQPAAAAACNAPPDCVTLGKTLNWNGTTFVCEDKLIDLMNYDAYGVDNSLPAFSSPGVTTVANGAQFVTPRTYKFCSLNYQFTENGGRCAVLKQIDGTWIISPDGSGRPGVGGVGGTSRVMCSMYCYN